MRPSQIIKTVFVLAGLVLAGLPASAQTPQDVKEALQSFYDDQGKALTHRDISKASTLHVSASYEGVGTNGAKTHKANRLAALAPLVKQAKTIDATTIISNVFVSGDGQDPSTRAYAITTSRYVFHLPGGRKIIRTSHTKDTWSPSPAGWVLLNSKPIKP